MWRNGRTHTAHLRVTLPDPVVTRRLLVRAAVLWFGTRVLFGFAGLLAAGVLGPPSIVVAPHTAIAIACVVGALGVLDVRRRHEHLLLANLGVSQWPVWTLSMVPALIAEGLVALVAAW